MKIYATLLRTAPLIALAGVMASPGFAQTTPEIPEVEGPIPEETGNVMHPAIFDPSTRPYLEELSEFFNMEYWNYVADEFFISGTAGGEPYETRIVVRRPADVEDWSGFTIIEPQHTAGAAQTWTYSRIGGMMSGHAYVEVVDNPGAIENLVGFNATRYDELTLASDETELQNELLAQVALMLKTQHPSGEEWNAPVLVMSGLSQTASATRDFMEAGQDAYRLPDGGPLIDGALLASTTGPDAAALETYDVPLIVVSTQSEWDDMTAEDLGTVPPDSELFRHYMVAGAPHLEARWFFATEPSNCELPNDHFMLMAYVYLGVEHMYDWLVNDIAPPNADRLEFNEDGSIVFDEYGNAVGGLRSPQLEVPTHNWITPNQGSSFLCGLAGTVEPLTTEQLNALYESPADYAEQLFQRTAELVEDRWFPEEYLFEISKEMMDYAPMIVAEDAMAAEGEGE